MANWYSFEPTQFFPEPLQRAVAGLNTAFKTAEKAGKAVEIALRLAAQFSAQASQNPVEAALRTAVDQIDQFVQGIVGNTQCHAIVIPIRKKALRRSGSSPMSRLDEWLTPGEPAYAWVSRAKTSTAGPEMFYRTLVESVGDAGDINRPDFPSNYAVVGACVLAGAETLQDLQVPVRLFTTLFTGNQRIAPAATLLPTVQNLKVTPAALRGGVGVHLRWTPVPPVNNAPLFSDDTVVAKEIFLVRTSRPFQQGFLTWDDLFNGEQPGDSGLLTKGDTQVIARLQNHGFVTAYVDTKNLLDPKKTYYFAACVRYTINGVVQPMGALSNVVRVIRKQAAPSSRQATPPDWIATPTLMQLFPPLNEAVNKIRLGIARLGTRTTSNSGAQQLLEQTIVQLQRLIAQWEKTVSEVQDVTERLQAITASGTPSGMYSTVIAQGRGGVNGWMAELAKRLSAEDAPALSDQSMVIGFVVLAGAPRLPDLSPILALLEMFFGNNPSNPLLTILQDLDGNPAVVRGVTASAPILGYDDALTPSTEPTC
jgi:hypothetical protein